jgi:hypothetical protein
MLGAVLWPLWLAAACQEPNPDFDGPASSGDTDPPSTSTESDPTMGTGSTGPVATGDGTGSSGEPPGTSSSGEPPGTSSSGESGGSTTGCMGMMCRGECIDPMTDPDHCGMCDNNCVGQQECIDGECIVP